MICFIVKNKLWGYSLIYFLQIVFVQSPNIIEQGLETSNEFGVQKPNVSHSESIEIAIRSIFNTFLLNINK